ncbi:hypothetical protein IV203_010375 [Nitzschia inconspicua]|uniref:Uncharacterized protein n=1 Tax=Nitzschia inconspicua TaxID=303405 RepID=A0A9K3KXJ8_9STRA|nr:hypothetical protein IV203_010375 [Nitzschia inconspicua]
MLDELRRLNEARSSPGDATFADGRDEVFKINDELDVLKGNVADLEQYSGERFERAEGTFGSPQQVQTWIVESSVPSCGMFWDLGSVLVAMMETTPKTSKEFADEIYSMKRAQLSRNEASLMVAMTHHCPGCLFGKNHARVDILDDPLEGLQACKSYAAWIGVGTSSFSTAVTKALEGHIRALRGTLSRTDGGESMARSLFDDCLKQWNALCRFTSTFYTKLVNVNKLSDAEAFKLVGRCWGAVFDTMRTHRDAVKLMGDLQSPANKAAVIWAVFQCHRVMNDFIGLEFEGHPAIVKEIPPFSMAERVDPSENEVKRLKTKKYDSGEVPHDGKRSFVELPHSIFALVAKRAKVDDSRTTLRSLTFGTLPVQDSN